MQQSCIWTLECVFIKLLSLSGLFICRQQGPRNFYSVSKLRVSVKFQQRTRGPAQRLERCRRIQSRTSEENNTCKLEL